MHVLGKTQILIIAELSMVRPNTLLLGLLCQITSPSRDGRPDHSVQGSAFSFHKTYEERCDAAIFELIDKKRITTERGRRCCRAEHPNTISIHQRNSR